MFLHLVLMFLNSTLTQIICLCCFGRNFIIVIAGTHSRIPNGILGLLCKDHYPGCVEVDGQLQPASSWEHYIKHVDRRDRGGRMYANRAERVLEELWVSLLGTTSVNISH